MAGLLEEEEFSNESLTHRMLDRREREGFRRDV